MTTFISENKKIAFGDNLKVRFLSGFRKVFYTFLHHKKFVILFLLTIAFFLRVYRLGYHDFWYDEAWTVDYAKYPWGNWNAPLYWIILHFWTKLFGFSEFSLRFPSLIFSLLSVILTFVLGKGLFNKKVGILASLFIGFSPFHLWYAQEARDYSMALFLGLSSSYLFFKAIKAGKLKFWLSFILVSTLGLYTNYFYIFLFIAQGLWLIFLRRFRLNFKEIMCFSIIVLGFSFYLPRFLSKFSYVWQGFWIPKPTWRSLIITLENFILGYNGFFSIYLMSNVLVSLFFISSLWAIRKKELRAPLIFCIFLSLMPILFVFLFSRIFFPIYLDRGLIIFSPYYYLILSVGAVSLNRYLRPLLIGLFLSVVVICGYNYFRDWMVMPLEHHLGVYIKKPIKPIVEFLGDAVDPNEDMLAFTNPAIIPGIIFYTKKKLPNFYYFFDPLFPDTSFQRPIPESKYNVQIYKIGKLKFKKLWVIASDWARSGELDENSRSVKEWLDKNLTLDLSREFQGLRIYRYIKNEIR